MLAAFLGGCLEMLEADNENTCVSIFVTMKFVMTESDLAHWDQHVAIADYYEWLVSQMV